MVPDIHEEIEVLIRDLLTKSSTILTLEFTD